MEMTMKTRSYLTLALALAIPYLASGDTVATPQWSAPKRLSEKLISPIPTHPEGGIPDAHIDTQGVAYAVWSDSNFTMAKAKIASFNQEWGKPKTLSEYSIGGQGPIAALNFYGQGSFPFIEYNHSPQQVVARSFNGGIGEINEINTSQTLSVAAAADGAGNTLIAWVNENKKTVEVASYFDNVVQPATYMGTFSQTPGVKQLAIAANFNGMGVLAWNQADEKLYASFYNGQQWSDAPLLISKQGASAFSAAIDLHGRAYFVWINGHCHPSGPVLAGSFQFEAPVSQFGNLSSGLNNLSPSIAASEQGKAVAVWTNLDLPAVEGSYFDGQCWYGPYLIQNLDPERAASTQPLVSVDLDCNAIVTWNREDGANGTYIESARFESLTQLWSPVSVIEQLNIDPNIQTLSNLALNVNLYGSAVALYGHFGAPTNLGILSGTILIAPEPPQNVTGSYQKVDGLTFKVITWEKSPTDGIASYQVLRNGYLVATVSSDQPLEYEEAGCINCLDTFMVRGLKADGTFSVFNFVRL